MTEKKPTASLILSILAGIFILLGGGVMSMMSAFIGPYGGMMGGYYGMMNGYNGYGMMRAFGYGYGLIGLLGLAFGIAVLISALMLNSRPNEHTKWGILILVFSLLSVFGSMMGGFGIGVLLGLIGGILAVTWKP